jgi:predicted dienelactone hydrolase
MGYWAKHLASRGYAVAALQHPGSDIELRRGKNPLSAYWSLWRAARDPRNYIDRVRDLSFVLKKLAAANREPGPWQGRLDLGRVAAAGHSMGALTALLAAGQDLGGNGSLREPALAAFIALSPPVPQQRRDFKRVYGPIAIPGLHISGSRDVARLGSTPAAERRTPFDHITRADQYLLWLHGGDHRTPLGHPPEPGRPQHEARFHQLILMATDAFLDAYLRGDAAAKAWLAGPGMGRAAAGVASWEFRPGNGAQKKGAPQGAPPKGLAGPAG